MQPVSNPAQTVVVLHQLLGPKCIQLTLVSHTREAVLEELVACVPQLADRPEARRKLLAALLERERLHSTGIGDGIALPHARDALAGVVDEPVLVFGRHPTGIAYGAVDGKPARLFFLLLAPSVTQHLAMLARISRLLRNEALRKALLAATTPSEVIASVREAEAGM